MKQRRAIRRIWEGTITLSDDSICKVDGAEIVKTAMWRMRDKLDGELSGPDFVTHLRRGVSVWAERVLI